MVKHMAGTLEDWPAALPELPEAEKELTRRSATWQCRTQVTASDVITSSNAQHSLSLISDQGKVRNTP
jgi:hypothetical protein